MPFEPRGTVRRNKREIGHCGRSRYDVIESFLEARNWLFRTQRHGSRAQSQPIKQPDSANDRSMCDDAGHLGDCYVLALRTDAIDSMIHTDGEYISIHNKLGLASCTQVPA